MSKLSTRSNAQPKPSTFDEKTSSVRAVAATESPAMVFDYDRFDVVPEVLLMSGLQLPANGRCPLLDSHSRGSVSNILGSARGFNVVGFELHCDVHFSADTAGQNAAEKVRDGHLTDFSVGYLVSEKQWIPDGERKIISGNEFKGPVSVVTRWALKELSVTPIGADPGAKARSEAGQNNIFRKGPIMKPELRALLVKRGMPDTASDAEAWDYLNGLSFDQQRSLFAEAGKSPADVRADQIRAEERERVTTIQENCRAVGMTDAFAADLVERGLTPEEAGQEIFREMAKTKTPLRAIGMGADASDKRRDAAVDGLCLRAGVKLKDPAPGAREYRGMSLFDIGRECLANEGINTRGMSRRTVADHIFGGRGSEMSGRSHTGSDFPALLANTAHKVLRHTYEQTASTWRQWCRVGDALDYKQMSRNQISEAPELLLISERGEYKAGSFSDAKEVFRIHKYGRTFGLSREAFINDDLGAFDFVPKAFALASARKINETAYGILTVNAAMADGTALFHADHGNLASEGGVVGQVSISTLSNARAAMRVQTGLNGVLLNVAPQFLIVPAAQETTGDTILNSAGHTDDSKNERVVNPFYRKLELVVDPVLDQTSTTAWYLAADPSQIDTVEVAFLDGESAPYIEDRIRWRDDALEWKVRLEFGAKAIDWRGLYKNTGA